MADSLGSAACYAERPVPFRTAAGEALTAEL
jgi:hypothetical protein